MTEFVQYALTMDLLEGEMVDAIAEGRSTLPGHLPLRDHYLPDAAAVLNTRQRLCAGGPLALCAIARPARGRRPADYVLLVQERGAHVLNASRRLAPIPKSFHEPLIDQREDTQLGATLQREMEEELFGRDDVDNTISPQRSADPMHPSRLSEPMRWLTEHSEDGQWLMECTGLGLNLVSGNYEFASLIVIHDEESGSDSAARSRPTGSQASCSSYPAWTASYLLSCPPMWRGATRGCSRSCKGSVGSPSWTALV